MYYMVFLIWCVIVFAIITVYKKHNKKSVYDIYLAGPMRGVENGNKDLFLKTAKTLRDRGFSVWNPAEQNDSSMTFANCIKNDLLAVIDECESVFVLPGWRESLGTNAEVFTAYVCGKKIHEIIFSPENDDFTYMKLKEIENNFVLPFSPGHKDFRTDRELHIPEKDVFNQTENNNE